TSTREPSHAGRRFRATEAYTLNPRQVAPYEERATGVEPATSSLAEKEREFEGRKHRHRRAGGTLLPASPGRCGLFQTLRSEDAIGDFRHDRVVTFSTGLMERADQRRTHPARLDDLVE